MRTTRRDVATQGAGVPRGPDVGVGGVVIHAGRALLIKRNKSPYAGRWSIPGGTVRRGERLTSALTREIREETGLVVRPGEILLVADQIVRRRGRLQHHFVIVDFLCRFVAGRLKAASDAREAAWVPRDKISGYHLPPRVARIIEEGFERES